MHIRNPHSQTPAMTAPATLDDDQVERLSQLLDQRAVPFKGFNLEALDGFLSALVVAPDTVPPSEWQPVVWGGTTPRWDGDDEALAVQALLLGHWNMAAARVRFEGDELPEYLAPLLWLPEELEVEQDDELDIGRDWAFGFFRGVELREAAWDAWLDEHEWIDEIFGLLEQLASGEVLASDPTMPAVALEYRERLEIIASLPGMLADLHHHRIDALTPREPIKREATPDRNAPCPCGSGKKYKKCCGA
jgi:uncharacterized protein